MKKRILLGLLVLIGLSSLTECGIALKNNDPTDTGHYYIIIEDKDNNMVSGGQFYVLSEMKEKFAYNIAGTDTYMEDGKLDVAKWQKDKIESGYTCY